ncbi:ABC transporter [Phlyctema vagabunda]|uniref:ABC transporter n=1 Tax=Phlyctema vagabunda TaxID=108571 RepID=A0ABR4PC56_9HELO
MAEFDIERQPLLHGSQPDQASAKKQPIEEDYPDSASSDDDSTDSGKDEDVAKHKKLLRESGGWWGYMKNFSIFVPHLVPRNQPKIQLYLILIAILVMAERALNVLIPQQEGIIVDKLTQISGTGKLPWKEVMMWFVFRFLNSTATRGAIQTLLEVQVDNWSTKQLKDQIFCHIMSLSMDFHVDKDSGELTKAVEQGGSLVELMRLLLFEVSPIILDLIIALFYVTYLFDYYFACIMLVVAITYGLITWKGTGWEARKRRVYSKNSRLLSKVQLEGITSWFTVTCFNRAGYQHQRVMKSLDATMASYTTYKSVSEAVETARDMTILLGGIVSFLLAAYRVAQGVNTVGNFVALCSYWEVFCQPLYILSYISDDITSNLVDAEAVLEVLQRKPTVIDSAAAQLLCTAKGEICFQNVSFWYDERKAIIKDISFTAQAGRTVALVGETGSGKSTILKLLLRFYDSTSGSISIDGRNIQDITMASLRDAIGLVPQDASLFNLSVMENIRYARLDASDEEVIQASKAACIHDKIMSFPDQYDTLVGERGVKLSGGELQRVSIARIMLKNPRIILLDEATSAVDSVTEVQIQEAFRRLAMNRTTFIIAHRLGTVMDADMILVLDEGRIVESGTHDELSINGGRYQRLWETQWLKNPRSTNRI